MILKSLAAIPAVLLTLSAVPALALDISIGGSASSGASAGSGDSGLSVDLGATGSVSASAGGGSDAGGDVSGSASADASGSTSADLALDDPLLDVIELINGSVWTDSSFSGVAGIDATTYDVGAWINSDNSAAFQSTLEANAGDIAELQAAIDANAEFSAWLDAENADVSSVVAVGVASDGSLAVFTHD